MRGRSGKNGHFLTWWLLIYDSSYCFLCNEIVIRSTLCKFGFEKICLDERKIKWLVRQGSTFASHSLNLLQVYSDQDIITTNV